MEDTSKAAPTAPGAPKVKKWKYVGRYPGPTIAFDRDPNRYHADELPAHLIDRYVQETPGQTLFVQE